MVLIGNLKGSTSPSCLMLQELKEKGAGTLELRAQGTGKHTLSCTVSCLVNKFF
jgi:hypothetical protein